MGTNPSVARVISGGQTGADQGGLRAARACGVATGGFAPAGFETEDGPASWLADFGLLECVEPGYPARTRANVRAADVCLWFGDPRSAGGRLTLRLCSERLLPHAVCSRLDAVEAGMTRALLANVADDLGRPLVVLVAGNRESRAPGIGAAVEEFVRAVLAGEGAWRPAGAAGAQPEA